MLTEEEYRKLRKILAKEPKLVKLKRDKDIVFVGDTHGDFETTKQVIESYPLSKYGLVFLGDYVDRGKQSKENIDYLLRLKIDHPNDIILIMGNHEAYPIITVIPADFWVRLSKEEFNQYSGILTKLPLAVSIDSVIALHGALPDVKTIALIKKIKASPKDKNFIAIIWGDFQDREGNFLWKVGGRPQYGKDYFNKIMRSLKKAVLIRSHDPYAPQRMYSNRCLTLFTSNAYGTRRTIAIMPKNKKTAKIDDLTIGVLK